MQGGMKASAPGRGTMIPVFSMSKLRKVRAGAAKRVARMRGAEGSTLLEFALTLPIFLTALTATASFSLGLYSMQQLSSATSGAIQTVATSRGLTTDTDPCALAVSSITSALPNWTASNFTYTLSITSPPTAPATVPVTQSQTGTGNGFSCASLEPYQTINYPVTLKVSYAYSWLPVLIFRPSSAIAATEGAMSY